MKDPLLPVGTVVSLINDDFQRTLQKVLIIGKRGVNDGSAYDYMGVNIYTGFIQADENSILFFNSTEIQEVNSDAPPDNPTEPENPEESDGDNAE